MATARRKTHFLIQWVADFIALLKADLIDAVGALTDPGHDHGGSTGSAGTGATGASGALGVSGSAGATTLLLMPSFRLAAPGTNHHAAYAGGAGAIDDVVGPWTMPLPNRCPQVATSAAAAAGNATVVGTDCAGNPLTEVQACAGGGATQQFARAFRTITEFHYSVDPGALQTVTLQTGNGLGLQEPFDTLVLLSVNGVVEAPASSHAATGTVVPTTDPDGSREYTVLYEADHAHGAGTLSAATHTHTGPSHSHAVASGATGVTVGDASVVHLDKDERAVSAADASSLATSVTLCKALHVAYNDHRTDLLHHKAADTTNTIAATLASIVDLATGITAANQIKAALNAHRSQAGVHVNNDAGSEITSPDATDQASLNTLLNELKADINLHFGRGFGSPSWRVVEG